MLIKINFIISLLFAGFYLLSPSAMGQEIYNNCADALELCPNKSFSVNNIAANITLCPGCEDDFNNCFVVNNSIWLKFTTNATGGNVQIDLSNLVFENNPGQAQELEATLFEATTPCNSASYSFIGNCIANATTNSAINAPGLTPNTTYYVVIDGNDVGAGITIPAECSLDITISGAGVNRPVGTISLNTPSQSICLNESIDLTASLADCPDNSDFNWYINDTLRGVTSNSVWSTSELQDGDIVKVETTCYTLCTDTVSTVTSAFSVYSFPVDAGADQTVNPNTTLQLNGATSANVFEWTPSFLLSDPNVLNPFVTIQQTTTFTLEATENGCTLSDYVTLTVEEVLDIPNTFSPNQDGVNDVWRIKGIEKYPDNLVTIYSRWGQKVFETRSYSKTKYWDGSLKRGKAAEGVYFYVIDLGNGEIIKGSLTLAL